MRNLLRSALQLCVLPVLCLPLFAEAQGEVEVQASSEQASGEEGMAAAHGLQEMLNLGSLRTYRNVLLAPIAEWVQEELFAARVIKKPELDFNLAGLNSAMVGAAGKGAKVFKLDENQGLQLAEGQTSDFSLPFPEASVLGAEQSVESLNAYEILWNLVFVQSLSQDMLSQVELLWFGTNRLLRKSQGTFFRESLFSDLLEVEDSPRQVLAADLLSRQVLRLDSPSVVAGFAQIFWRLFGDAADQGWIYSPVTGRSRRVFGSNLSDGILGGTLSAGDIFVWGDKIQGSSVNVVAEKTMLVFFSHEANQALRFVCSEPSKEESKAGLEAAGLAGEQLHEANCPSGSNFRLARVIPSHKDADPSRQGSMVRWNYETNSLPGMAPWLPTSAFLAPRRCLILELSPNDPLRGTGREILVVDKQSFLPFYKIVYDNLGQMNKVVVGGWGIAANDKLGIKFPFASFVVAVDASAKTAVALGVQGVETFLGRQSTRASEVRGLLDIAKHEKTAADGAADGDSR